MCQGLSQIDLGLRRISDGHNNNLKIRMPFVKPGYTKVDVGDPDTLSVIGSLSIISGGGGVEEDFPSLFNSSNNNGKRKKHVEGIPQGFHSIIDSKIYGA